MLGCAASIALTLICSKARLNSSSSIFISGWRPAIGWVCVVTYTYNYVVMPLITWFAKWHDIAAPNMITLDTGELTTLLLGMLGIGGLRTFEKIKGIATK